ncbi:MAG: beta-lactamase family protein [Actinobacteria bacterium]|nr:beta-lactamase family protein [Actinomycetota bacterium]MBI3686346.1 beta-lactamase family protein [Actinomycetota bacterium]
MSPDPAITPDDREVNTVATTRTRRRRRHAHPVATLGSAPADEVLEAAFGPLVPRPFGGILAVAVDETGPHTWTAGTWTTLPPLTNGAPGGASPCVTGVPADGGPVFQIGSITKVFTATLLAQAVATGEVELDGPVEDVLAVPLRVGGRPVTLRDLVSHRSGLPRVPHGMRRHVDRKDPYRTMDTARLLRAVAEHRDRVRAGRDAAPRYSNFGFAVLGLALARSLGTSWEQALTERVLLPAGLTATAAPTAMAAPRAVLVGRGGRPVPPWDLAAFAPAGGLWMSGPDLAAWLGLLTEAVRPGPADGPAAGPRDAVLAATRMTLVPQVRTWRAQIGMAWHFFERDGVAWHNGGVLGASSFVGVDQRNARAVGVFALGNPRAALDRAAMRGLTGR